MSLPKLETPTFKIKVPSTSQSITFRPFLVKEEKLLLMLTDDSSSSEKFKLIRDLITTCAQDEFDFSKLTTFDIEYIFISLRSKSVGQEVSLNVKCSECETQCPISIDLDQDIFVDNLNKSNKNKKFTVPITNTVGMTLRYPFFEDLGKDSISEDNVDVMSILAKSIESIYDDKTVYDPNDYTLDEIKEFINNLSMKDLEKVKEFFDNTPKVKCKIDFTCPSCKHENKRDLDGLVNFF